VIYKKHTLVAFLIAFLALAESAAAEIKWDQSNLDVIQATKDDLSAERYPAAQARLEQAIKSMEASKPDDPQLSVLLVYLANVFSSEKRYTDAEKVARRALALADKVDPGNSETRGFALQGLGAVFMYEDRNEEAEPLLKEAIECLPDTKSTVLSKLAFISNARGDYKKAEQYYQQTIELSKDDPVEQADALQDMGNNYLDAGDLEKAEKSLLQGIDVLRKSGDNSSFLYADLQGSLGGLYEKKGDLPAAEKAYRTSLAITAQNKDANKVNLSSRQKNLASLLVDMGRYSEAERLFLEAFMPYDETTNVFRGRAVYLENVNARAVYNASFADPHETPGNAKEINPILANAAQRLGENSTAYAKVLEDVAAAYSLFSPRTAPMKVPLLEKAIQIRTAQEGAGTPQIANDKMMIALRLMELGDNYEKPALESCAIWKDLLAKKDKRLADWQPNQVMLAYAVAGLGQAKRQQAEELAEIPLTQFSPGAGSAPSSLSNLGYLYELLGEFGKASTAYDAGFELARSHGSLVGMANLAVFRARVSYEQKDLDEAWQRALTAKELCEKAWGPDCLKQNVNALPCLELLSGLSLARGDLQSAEQYQRLIVAHDRYPPVNATAASHYIGLAQILFYTGRNDEARKILTDTVAIISNYTKAQFWDKVQLAKAHGLLGELDLIAGDYSGSESHFRQSWRYHLLDKSSEGVLGKAAAMNGIAEGQVKLGNKEAAAGSVLMASYYLDKHIQTALPELSLAEQCAFIKYVSDQINPLLTYGVYHEPVVSGHAKPVAYGVGSIIKVSWEGKPYQAKILQVKDGKYLVHYDNYGTSWDEWITPGRIVSATKLRFDTVEESFQYVMRWQGLLVDAVRRHSTLEAKGNSQLVARLKQVRDELSQLSGGSSNQTDITHLIATKTEEKEALERKLLLASDGSSKEDPAQKAKAKDFIDLLPDDEAFVDFLNYKRADTGRPAYFAFVVTRKDGLKALDLGDGSAIDKAATSWLAALSAGRSVTRDIGIEDTTPQAQSETPATIDSLAQPLAQMIWAPVQQLLAEGVSKIWICPDAELARLPWNTLIEGTAKHQYLVSEIASPRAFIALKGSKDYNQQLASTAAHNKVLLAGGIRFRDDSLYLPGTAKEVAHIENLAGSDGFKVTALTEQQATKDALLVKLSQANYAHLATHGFFDEKKDSKANTLPAGAPLPPRVAMQRDVTMVPQLGGGAGSILAGRNPLLLSGLLVAPNNTGKNNKSALDDRLTAEELVGQDLSHCRLIVLSACNSGRGKDYAGQGVMGLRAALAGAGAKGILLSLWPVDDDATRELMEQFYKHLWDKSKPMQPVEALHAAQEAVRNAPGGKWQSPVFWAGWVFDGLGW
jgi:CHAT domain-containing protein